ASAVAASSKSCRDAATTTSMSMSRPPAKATLFPYTTLFRSRYQGACRPRPKREPSDQSRSSGPAKPATRIAARVHGGFERDWGRSEEHTSELQSQSNLVCRLLLEKKKKSHLHQGQEEGQLNP